MSENMSEKRAWHTPVLRSLDTNRTAQNDPAFTTDDSSSDDFVGNPDSRGGDPSVNSADHS